MQVTCAPLTYPNIYANITFCNSLYISASISYGNYLYIVSSAGVGHYMYENTIHNKDCAQDQCIVMYFGGLVLAFFTTWWRHQMETFSALLAFCAGNSPVTGEFPAQRAVTRSFHVFFDLRLNKQLSKQSWGWWFETPSRSLWRNG